MIKITKILCPTDFSEASQNALRYAIEFARSANAQIILLHVAQMPVVTTEAAISYSAVEEKQVLDMAQQELDAIVQKLPSGSTNIFKSLIVGTPDEVILQEAAENNVDIIIIGTQGKTGIKRLLLGSITEAVLRKAVCPVLVVKAHEKEFLVPETPASKLHETL